jgi:adenylate cyclase
VSRPGSVLVDRTMADALAAEPAYRLRSRRPESVRGYHHLQSWQLQRATGDTAEAAPTGRRRR